ncbi:MAG: peptidylprolyl isomerase, partial [Sphingomonas oligoaromativorans]
VAAAPPPSAPEPGTDEGHCRPGDSSPTIEVRVEGLDKHYTVFGRVVSGMQYVDAIQRGEPPAHPTVILRAVMGDDPAAGTPPPALPVAPAVQAPATLPSGPITPPAGSTPKN